MAQDITGLPNVDLQPVIDDLKAQQQDKGQDDKTKGSSDDGQTLDLDQFKNPKDMLKGYKEIQAAFTTATTENATLKKTKVDLDKKIAELEDQIELSKGSSQFSFNQDTDTEKPLDQRLAENPEKTLDQFIMDRVGTLSIAEALEEEKEKDEVAFRERYGYAQMLSREYPHLAKSGRGIRKLFEKADKIRSEDTKKSAYKGLEIILGEPPTEEQITKFKTLIKGESTEQPTKANASKGDAFMPDTTSSTRTGAAQDQGPNRDKEIAEAVEKGDVDATLDAVFLKTLEE